MAKQRSQIDMLSYPVVASWAIGTTPLATGEFPPLTAGQRAVRRVIASRLVETAVANGMVKPENAAAQIELLTDPVSHVGVTPQQIQDVNGAMRKFATDPAFMEQIGPEMADAAIQAKDDAMGAFLNSMVGGKDSVPLSQMVSTVHQARTQDSLKDIARMQGTSNRVTGDKILDVFDTRQDQHLWNGPRVLKGVVGEDGVDLGTFTDGLAHVGIASSPALWATWRGRKIPVLKRGLGLRGKLLFGLPFFSQLAAGGVNIARGASAWNSPEQARRAAQELLTQAGKGPQSLSLPFILERQRQNIDAVFNPQIAQERAIYNARRNIEFAGQGMGRRNASYWTFANYANPKSMVNRANRFMAGKIGQRAANNVERLAGDFFLEPQALMYNLPASVRWLRKPSLATAREGFGNVLRGARFANLALDIGRDVTRNIAYNPHVVSAYHNRGLGAAAGEFGVGLLGDWGDRAKAISNKIDRELKVGRYSPELMQQLANIYMRADFIPASLAVGEKAKEGLWDTGTLIAGGLGELVNLGPNARSGNFFRNIVIGGGNARKWFDSLVQDQFDPKKTKNWGIGTELASIGSTLTNPGDFFSALRQDVRRRSAQREFARRNTERRAQLSQPGLRGDNLLELRNVGRPTAAAFDGAVPIAKADVPWNSTFTGKAVQFRPDPGLK